MVQKTDPPTKVEDSASTDKPVDNKAQPKGNGGNNTAASKKPQQNAGNKGPSPKVSNSPTKGFPEGNKVLESYGLSVSGRKERILSFVKTDKFFHLVEDAWNQLVDAKPWITQRFSLAEFRHCAALQLYQRIEQVKFDALGTKPSAPVRIPLPRNLRVFLPIWSALANIGVVHDDDLRVTYIPDAALPHNRDADTPQDMVNLVACCLYDWSWSWDEVQTARQARASYDERIGSTATVTTNEPPVSQGELINLIADTRRKMMQARTAQTMSSYRVINGRIYRLPDPIGHEEGWSPTDDEVIADDDYFELPETYQSELQALMVRARAKKEEMIRPRQDVAYDISTYQLSDGQISAGPGAYGSWLRWDPQLWIDYEQVIEILSSVAMFSLSMPVESEGTYAWLLPVESREGEPDIFCKMPKVSISPATWISALMLQMSTLSASQRSTWYAETDRLGNLLGLRARYIRSAIKRPAPTEQYGTY